VKANEPAAGNAETLVRQLLVSMGEIMLTLRDYHLTLHDVADHQPEYLETIFSLANGHFGVRANDPITGNPITGTLINGFYETAPITYGEAGIGYAT